MKKTRTRRPLRPRRTNAERTAQTRGRLIDAAIDILYRAGHSATTTIEVADVAGVSRGAMLHHFPTRVDLLLAVASYIIEEQRRERRERMQVLGRGPGRFFGGADVSWDVQKQPSTLALLEIMMASRSDAELRKSLAPLRRQMAEMRAAAAELLAADLGIEDAQIMVDLLHVHLAALRGLAIDLVFTDDKESVERARRLFTHYEHTFGRELAKKKKATKA